MLFETRHAAALGKPSRYADKCIQHRNPLPGIIIRPNAVGIDISTEKRKQFIECVLIGVAIRPIAIFMAMNVEFPAKRISAQNDKINAGRG